MLVKYFRAVYRGLFFSLHVFSAILICLTMPLASGRKWYTTSRGKKLVTWWAQRATRIIHINITTLGKQTHQPHLFVANHISFLDIIVLASITPVTFLAKSTIKSWPLIGFISNSIGTIFIQRQNKKDIYNAILSSTNTLVENNSLVIFPEGTTTTGHTVKKFNPSLFQAAINAGKPVQPIALRYSRQGKIDNIAAFVDDDNFINRLFNILAEENTQVTISYCQHLDTSNKNRNELATISHQRISRKIHCTDIAA